MSIWVLVFIATNDYDPNKMFQFAGNKYYSFLAILAASSWTAVDPETWKTEENAIFNQDSKILFNFLTDLRYIPEVSIHNYLYFCDFQILKNDVLFFKMIFDSFRFFSQRLRATC